MKDIHHILFVCTGNSCRSIMAEAYAKKRVEEEGLDIEIRSAGTLGLTGLAPTKEALKVIEDENIDTSDLRSKALTEDLIKWADLILVMEPDHKSTAINMLPEANGRVHYLGEFRNKNEVGDIVINDPIGKPLAFYRVSFNIIKRRIEELIKWIKE